jgi:condensation domain-containing protein/phosphopantetheine binding protein
MTSADESTNLASKVVEEAWRDVLDTGSSTRDDQFFALGGNSRAAAVFVARVEEALGIEFPLEILFYDGTLGSVLDACVQAHADASAPSSSDNAVRSDDGLASLLQTRWMPSRDAGGLASRLMPFAFRVCGPLDVQLLGRAVTVVCRSHESLRTGFLADDQVGLVRHVADDVTIMVQHDRDQNVGQWLSSKMVPFDVTTPPLLRVHVLSGPSADEHFVLFLFDHLVCDGHSIEILMPRVSRAYQALAANETPHLPAETLPFGEWATAQRRALTPQVQDALLAKWASLLGNDPALLGTPLPGYDVEQTVASSKAIKFTIGSSSARGLAEMARINGVTNFSLGLTLFARTLRELRGQQQLNRILISTSVANRHSAGEHATVGLLAHNTHILLDGLDEAAAADLGTHARRTQDCVGRSLALSAVPHRIVRESLWPEAMPHMINRRWPVVYFAFDRDITDGLTFPGAKVEQLDFDWGSLPPGVEMWLTERGSGISGIFRWEAERLPSAVAEEIVERFRAAVDSLAYE